MPIRARLASLWRTLFRQARLEHDLDDELRTYVEGLTEQKIHDGADRAAARRAALAETGGVEQVKERVRDVRTGVWLEQALRDVRISLRMLRRTPGFTAVVVATLALSIGANTAIFSVVNGVLLRRAPFADVDRLVMVWETDRNSGTTREPASVPDFLDFRTRSRRVERLAAVAGGEVNLTPLSGDPVRLAAMNVTHDLLPMVGVAPVAGRTFTAAEDARGGPAVAMISESLWEGVFNRDPRAVGGTIRLDDTTHTIVGVLPDGADFGMRQILSAAAYSRGFADRGERARVDVWLPLQADPGASPRDTHPIFMIGRLAPGASLVAARQESATVAADLERAYVASNAGRGTFVEPLAEVVFGPVRPSLLLLLGAVGFVLLVACVNIASLMLARGTTRAREVAIRTALGANAGRLTRQFLVEGLVLTLAAAAVGVGVAMAGLRGLTAIAPADVPRLADVSIDGGVLGVTLSLSVLVGLAFGMVPILQARRVDLRKALKDGGGQQASAGLARSRTRSALVVAEIALAVVLLAGAGLLIRSFWALRSLDPGFHADGVLKAEYQLPLSRYPVNFAVWPNFVEFHAFTGSLLRRAEALPGVTAAAIAGNHPLDQGFTNSFSVVGREAEARSWPEISVRRVTPGYFRVVALPLVTGRLLQATDTTTAPPVLVINQAAARRFFTGLNPIGARILLWGAQRTIVGVVADERFHGLAAAAPIGVYLPLAQAPSANGAGVLLVRTGGNPVALAGDVRAAIRAVDPGLAVFGLEPLRDTVSRSLSERRFTMVLLALFAALAILIAAIGVHGVLSYGVAQRTREIGVRVALGARPARIVRLVLAEGLVLVAAGLAIGLAGAGAITRLMARLLFGVAPTDPATFAAVGFLLLAVGLIAGYLPARRAASIDPVITLRSE